MLFRSRGGVCGRYPDRGGRSAGALPDLPEERRQRPRYQSSKKYVFASFLKISISYILEEFRAWWVDRMVLSLINRGQIKPQDFVAEASGAINIKPETRKLLFQKLFCLFQTKLLEGRVHRFSKELTKSRGQFKIGRAHV